ncbi:GTP 3',8-cyclase MoaA, partial [Verrucomicrobia bacterium]|nr:GTP 3',8-cyclase MoaA [Verrucomicrobiota bacterium]
KEIRERLVSRLGLQPVAPKSPAETAKRWRFPDGRGEIGIIAPVTEPFCGHCNRIRLTADGRVRTCLFSLKEPDLKPLLREGGTDEDIKTELYRIVTGKEPGHRIGKDDYVQPDRSMSCIGG